MQDRMAEKLVKLMDCLDELIEKIIEEQLKQKIILKQLEKIEYPYKLILNKVYISGKTLLKVAEEMDYDYKYICKQHVIALKKFDNTTKDV